MGFDTLKFSRQLSAAGMEGAQADRLAACFAEMLKERENERAVSRAEFQLLQDQLALLGERVSLLRAQAGYPSAETSAETNAETNAGLDGPPGYPLSASLLSRKGLLHALAVLVGVLAAHTTLLAWLLDLL